MTADHALEAEAYTSAITQGGPVWVEAPDHTKWLAYDEGTGLKLLLTLRAVGLFRRPRWCLYATDRDGNVSKAVMCEPRIDPSIHIAENLAARGRLTFPAQETP